MQRTFRRAALAALLIAVGIATPALAREPEVPSGREQIQLSFAPLVKRASPAVVNIYTKTRIRTQRPSFLDDPVFRTKIGALEVDLLALEFTELRSLASAAAGTAPGPESSILKLKGTEIQQRIAKLTVEAGGIYSAATGARAAGPRFAASGMQSYLSSRAYTIYGGASEVQKDVIAKNVLGIRSSRKQTKP